MHVALWLSIALPIAASSAPASDEASAEPVPDAAIVEESIWDILDEQRDTSNKVVAATKTEQKLSDTPAVVAVISAPEIEARGYRSVAEAVRATAGVVVFDDQILPDVSARGIGGGQRSPSNTIKVMIDGHATSFRPDTTNFLGPELLPIQMVERIEVIRGPASALYGANAFLGVINIVTKKASEHFSAAYRLSGYLLNDRQPGGGAGVSFSTTAGRVQLSLGVAADYINASAVSVQQTFPAQLAGVGLTSANDQKLPKSFYGGIAIDAGPVGELRLDANLQHLDTYAEFSDWSVATHQNRISILNGFGRLRWQKRFTDAVSASAFVGVHAGSVMPNEKLHVGRSDLHFQRELSSTEVSGGAEVVWKFRPQDQLSGGVDFASDGQQRLRYTMILDEATASDPVGTRVELAPAQALRYNNIGAQVQLLFNPWAWLGTVAGFRFDYNTGYGQGYSPRVGIVAKPIPQLSFKALYGRSFKAPSGVQLEARPALGPTDVVGNAALRSQVGDTLELVAAADPLPWLKLQVVGFLVWVSGQITFERYGINFQARNTDNVSSYGIEGEVRVQSRRVDAYANVTWARVRSQSEIEKVLGTDRRFATTPEWWLAGGVTVRVPEAFLQFYAELRAVGDRQSSSENTRQNATTPYLLAPYVVVDAAISTLELKLLGTAVRAMFRVQNLLGMRYATAGYSGYDAPNLGRTFELVLGQRF